MQGTIRFAPSPTGFLHQGHLLSALCVWAAAKIWNLHIHLRIEDHDKTRTRPEYVKSIYQDLETFGFKYDSQSVQSSRINIYNNILNKLTKSGLVYPCTCSRKQLLAENPISKTGEIIYQGKCLKLWQTNLLSIQQSQMQQPHNLRFIVTNKVIKWTDFLLGEFCENPIAQCGDFSIKDRDNCYTYQFAVCTDDLTQHITHIVRGQDILNSTARQIVLTNAISNVCKDCTPKYERPLYIHHPLIVDSCGKKLSKREHAYSLRQSLEKGNSVESILGDTLYKANILTTNAPITLNKAIAATAIFIEQKHCSSKTNYFNNCI